MRTKCPVCGGCGTVPKSYPKGTVLFVSVWPRETCQNCSGAKWVGTPDNLNPIDDLIRRSGGDPTQTIDQE